MSVISNWGILKPLPMMTGFWFFHLSCSSSIVLETVDIDKLRPREKPFFFLIYLYLFFNILETKLKKENQNYSHQIPELGFHLFVLSIS